MGRSKSKTERHDENRVRIIWDRYDTYCSVRAVVRGRRIGPLRVAFFDREQGIMPVVARITESYTVEAWPRSKSSANLAAMAHSINPIDRRVAQAIVSTRAGGTWIDPARQSIVHFLTAPDDSDVLPGPLPLGGYVPGVGQGNWAVDWDQLQAATTVADLRSGSEEEE